MTVTWTRPEVTGRSDFYYTLQYSDPDNIGEFLPANPIKIVNSALSVSHTVTGLQPYTTYTIRVTSHNGVSDQDSENAALRIVTIQVRTLEGGKLWILSVHKCMLLISTIHIQFQVPHKMSGYSVMWLCGVLQLSPMVKSLGIKSGSLELFLEPGLSLKDLMRAITLLVIVIPETLVALFKFG